MKLIEVKDPTSKKQFHQLPDIIYRSDQNFIQPLKDEIEKIFDPDKNASFIHGDARRWVLEEGGHLVGRIAAFYDKSKTKNLDQPTGGIGFFECINRQDDANLLFDTARNWLAKQGMEAMDGPINFGENMFHWGLQIEAEGKPTFGMQYHPKYYKSLFENYGFRLYYRQFSYVLDTKKPFPERFWKVAERVVNKPDVRVEHFRFDKKDQFINDLLEIYNDTWHTFRDEAASLHFEDIDAVFRDAKAIINEELIWFVYKNDEPVCFMVMIPDVNQILAHFNGKLNFLDKIRFLYLKNTKTITRVRALVMGIKPQYQRLGMESAIFWKLKEVFGRLDHYTEVELSWSGDFNPRVIALYEATGAEQRKTHATYRYLFDRSKEFVRYYLPDVEKVPRRVKKNYERIKNEK